ncbi:SMI1/KNR4 family protein [Microbispora sp. KK1-11]|uniref:SMI1/KNR4 family protein n=1 Tax=Microbispora sp. KK1-11 TaxID=2053005 RepID=UPI001157073B|nr:SMI1/KNR4 family protein [Microbispora sp. KK1-11]TQS25517.1 SMI1/KNR4 family protein [Microbispora sp. KK1-11]
MNTSYGWSDLFPEEEPAAQGPHQPPLPPGHGLHPPADELEVIRLEERLGVNLPPSYRQFLLYSDGWGVEEYSLWPVAEVGWLRDVAPSTVEAWSVSTDEVPDDLYFVYGKEQNNHAIRMEYLPDTLLVGLWDGDLLLNPHVMTPDGEWEAWLLAAWMPGAERHRSFWDLMKDLCTP